jgi:hypothetical protein
MQHVFLLYIGAFLVARVAGFALLVANSGALGALFIPCSLALRVALVSQAEHIKELDDIKEKLFFGSQLAAAYFFLPIGCDKKDLYKEDSYYHCMFGPTAKKNVACHIAEGSLVVASVYIADFRTGNAFALVVLPACTAVITGYLVHLFENILTPSLAPVSRSSRVSS